MLLILLLILNNVNVHLENKVGEQTFFLVHLNYACSGVYEIENEVTRGIVLPS